MADGVFRKKNGFTAVGNSIARDKVLSLKAKGLFLLIQSYINIPDSTWKKSDFQRMAIEGNKAFESAWKELKENGYLKSHIRTNGKNGCQFSTEYELLDEPQLGAHTFYYNANGELTKTNLSKETGATGEKRKSKIKKNLRTPQNGSNANGIDAMGNNANGDNNNNIILTSKTTNNNSINLSRENEDGCDYAVFGVEKKIEETLMYTVEDELYKNNGIPYCYAIKKEKMKNVLCVMAGWNVFAQFYHYDKSSERVYVLAVECLYEMATSTKSSQSGNSHISYKNVIDQINKIYREHKGETQFLMSFLSSAVEKFVNASRAREISHSKAYMKMVLWNNFCTFEVDWDCFFNHTYYGMLDKKEVEINEISL